MRWRTVPLKRLASVRVSNVDKKTVDGDTAVRLCNYTDVYYRDTIRPDHEYMAATATRDQLSTFRLRAGDVLITKDSETADDIGVPAYVAAGAPDLVCGYHLAMIRPVASALRGRYLYWAMSSSAVREQLSSMATGITRYGLRTDGISLIEFPLPTLEQQQAIADFLDAETARIDAIVDRKRVFRRLLAERRGALREEIFVDRPGWSLKRLLYSRPAYGVLVPEFVDAGLGVPMIRINALTLDGRVDAERLVWIGQRQSEEFGRTVVAVGDLILSVVGSMGRSAVIDQRVVGSNLNRPLARLRPRHDLPVSLLWHWTQTTQFLDQADLATGGDTAQPTLNLGDLADFTVGLPNDPSRWNQLLDLLEEKSAPIEHAERLLQQQTDLLREHRQALITAAVTGELEIPGATA